MVLIFLFLSVLFHILLPRSTLLIRLFKLHFTTHLYTPSAHWHYCSCTKRDKSRNVVGRWRGFPPTIITYIDISGLVVRFHLV
uniref:Putative secreted peptide n=1 Tax=Anopheles braziliensis TaxID=58242 RepID=A0A2M3ZQC3_9DIPT